MISRRLLVMSGVAKKIGRMFAVLTAVGLALNCLPAQAVHYIVTYNLGPSPTGTELQFVSYPDNMGNLAPWITKGTLPAHSILSR